MTHVSIPNGTLGEGEKVLVAKSKEEFAKRRKILITSLPDAVDLEVCKFSFFKICLLLLVV